VLISLVITLSFVAASIVRHLASERRQAWIKQAFSRYVSPNLVSHLIDHPGALELGGKRQQCSFVFTDLAGFTTLMERMNPADAVGVLNVYLDRMIAIAFSHQGTLDRVVGDAVAIMFSAPLPQADHQRRALACALDMQRFAQKYEAQLQTSGMVFCQTRIGVHTGEVIVGNFGGAAIFDYRALGDPVNTASRLEAANKLVGTLVCVSEATLQGCPDASVRPIGRLLLPGKIRALMTYEPRLNALLESDAASDHWAAYTQAFELMRQESPQALPAFAALHRAHPQDRLVKLHHDRLAAGALGDLIEMGSK
jgi:adenylate cyclase